MLQLLRNIVHVRLVVILDDLNSSRCRSSLESIGRDVVGVTRDEREWEGRADCGGGRE
jgi:hypothetical protein